MAVRTHEIQPAIELDDTELARRAAAGDGGAFEELYRRHASAAWGVALAATFNRDDAADAVSEAFTKLLTALAAGRLAPDVPFRPYLLVTTRNVAIDQHRRTAGVVVVPDDDVAERAAASAGPGEHAMDQADYAFVGQAFRDLPERWRTVLWLTEVEGMSASVVGARLGLTANNAAQLAHRARAGLRQRYLQAHLQHAPAPECAATVEQLGAYVAGRLSPRLAAAIDQHLAGCEECRTRRAQLEDVGTGLRALVIPIPAGLGAAALARYRGTFPAPPVAPTPGPLRKLVNGPERAVRSLSLTTGALLTAGVITAGLMSSGGGPAPVRGSRSEGGVALSTPPTVRTFPVEPAVDVVVSPTSAPLAVDDTGAAPSGVTPPQPASMGTDAVVAPSPSSAPPAAKPAPTKPAPAPASPPATPPPVAQVALGANLSVVKASGAVGLGGGCTGLSVNGSTSCAPPAPAQPGITAKVTTPLGTVGTASAPLIGG